MSKSVVVIGGGVIGLCSAYYLLKEGHQVVVIDQSSMDFGASYVNAGYLSPSHIIPLAAPGVMKKGLKWMFNSSSPLYIKPRLDLDFLEWVWAFNKSCNKEHVKKSISPIKDITLLSQELFDEIKKDEAFSFHLEKKGLLMLCQTEKALEEEIKVTKIAKEQGLHASEISFEELRKLEPNTTIDVKGATYFKCDSHLTPGEFMKELKAYLVDNGVEIFKNEKVKDLKVEKGKIISVVTKEREFKADDFVLTAGSWSHFLSRKLGLNLLLQAGKGYCINTNVETGISIPAILAEAKVAITPMNGFTRFAGTMEIAGVNHNINNRRVDAIANAVQRYYPDVQISTEEKQVATSGLRPVSPDGLPYIGKTKACENLVIATGHAMMGLSMATGTGKLVSELISEKKPTIKIEAFRPDRRF